MIGARLALAAMAALLLAAIGWAIVHQAHAPVHASVSDIRIASAEIDLPDDSAALPAGAAGERLTTACTGCHSAELLLTQPRLSPAAWAAEVKKMRDAYHAPVAPGDDAAIVAALLQLPGQRAR